MSIERHRAQEENVGAYLLGALTEIEVRAFEGHLEECPLCRDEIERLRPVVDALPRSVEPVNPPEGLKASIMEAVHEDLRSRGGARTSAGRPRGGAFARIRERLPGAGSGLSARPGLALAGVALVLVAGGVGGFAVTRIDGGGEDRARTLTAKVDKGRIPFASGSLVVPGEDDKGAILRVQGMPSLDRNAVYQVWLKRGEETISQSLFNVGRDGDGAAAVSADLSGADAVLVTRERAGGARAPSEEPVLSVTL